MDTVKYGVKHGATEQRRHTGTAIKVVVVFVLDATGSMASCIAAVRDALTGFVDILCEGNLDPSLGLVIFRDEIIGEKTLCYPVGTDPERIKAVLRETPAKGGGDEPESSLPAIMKALDLPGYPSDARKVLLHVTDASCHDPEQGITASKVLKRLQREGVIVHACCPRMNPYDQFVNHTGGMLIPLTSGIRKEELANIMLTFAHTTVKTVGMGETKGIQDLIKDSIKKTRILGR